MIPALPFLLIATFTVAPTQSSTSALPQSPGAEKPQPVADAARANRAVTAEAGKQSASTGADQKSEAPKAKHVFTNEDIATVEPPAPAPRGAGTTRISERKENPDLTPERRAELKALIEAKQAELHNIIEEERALDALAKDKAEKPCSKEDPMSCLAKPRGGFPDEPQQKRMQLRTRDEGCRLQLAKYDLELYGPGDTFKKFKTPQLIGVKPPQP